MHRTGAMALNTARLRAAVSSGAALYRDRVTAVASPVLSTQTAPRCAPADPTEGLTSGREWKCDIGQGATVEVDLRECNVPVHIVGLWDEHCAVDLMVPPADVGAVNAVPESAVTLDDVVGDNDDGTGIKRDRQLHIGADAVALAAVSGAAVLRVGVPQLGNAVVRAKGSVTMAGTIEGDVSFTSTHGDAAIRSVRGDAIVLEAPRGEATVVSVAEGALTVDAMSFQAKKCIGAAVEITTSGGDVRVSALYSPAAQIVCFGGDVDLGTVQGDATIACSAGDVSVSGMNGRVDATAGPGCTVGVHFDTMTGTSFLRSDGGDARVSVTAPAVAKLQFHSERSVIVSPGGHGTFMGSSDEFAAGAGYVEGMLIATESDENLPFRTKAPSVGLGKISAEGRDGSVGAMTSVEYDDNDEQLPTIVVSGTDSAVVEVLDWMSMMMRKRELLGLSRSVE